VEAVQKRIRQRTFTTLDGAVVNHMIEIAPIVKGFFQAVETGLSDNPVEAKKFSAEVFDAMGDLAAGAFGFLLLF
jgi:hypothetical protein